MQAFYVLIKCFDSSESLSPLRLKPIVSDLRFDDTDLSYKRCINLLNKEFHALGGNQYNPEPGDKAVLEIITNDPLVIQAQKLLEEHGWLKHPFVNDITRYSYS